MLKIKWIMAVAAFAFISACSNQENQSKSESDNKAQTECNYTVVNDSTAVNWTAFKTSARVGVGGHFDKIKIWTSDNAQSPKDLLVGTSFDIATASVNSGNKVRDPKLITFFFNMLKDGNIIKGEIISAEGSDVEGNGQIKLMFNGVSKKVEYNYHVSNNKIHLKTGINLDEWDGSAAVKSLNTECKDLHTGADGESKLWPDVEIEVIALFKKNC